MKDREKIDLSRKKVFTATDERYFMRQGFICVESALFRAKDDENEKIRIFAKTATPPTTMLMRELLRNKLNNNNHKTCSSDEQQLVGCKSALARLHLKNTHSDVGCLISYANV